MWFEPTKCGLMWLNIIDIKHSERHARRSYLVIPNANPTQPNCVRLEERHQLLTRLRLPRERIDNLQRWEGGLPKMVLQVLRPVVKKYNLCWVYMNENAKQNLQFSICSNLDNTVVKSYIIIYNSRFNFHHNAQTESHVFHS